MSGEKSQEVFMAVAASMPSDEANHLKKWADKTADEILKDAETVAETHSHTDKKSEVEQMGKVVKEPKPGPDTAKMIKYPGRISKMLKPGFRWNPLVSLGRNIPCPCGKRKDNGSPVKYKNCHLPTMPAAIPELMAKQYEKALASADTIRFEEDPGGPNVRTETNS